MAKREENLKKINDELEKMTYEELDQVSGGSPGELANDSRFLNVLLQGEKKYHQCDRYGEFTMFWSSGAREELDKAWNSLGVEVERYAGENTYIRSWDKKKMSQAEAWEYAESKVGKHLTKEQWNW